jgi:hypothetical protein
MREGHYIMEPPKNYLGISQQIMDMVYRIMMVGNDRSNMTVKAALFL